MNFDKWITKLSTNNVSIKPLNDFEKELIETLVELCESNRSMSEGRVGFLYAAAFDLLITAEYYKTISHSGWLYCPSENPRLLLPFTNCCPIHVLNEKFFFHPSNKPTSGKIGAATSRLLLLLFSFIFKQHNLHEEIIKGVEPVDALIINRKLRKVLLAEIKASPLITLTAATHSERITEEAQGEVISSHHKTVTNSNLYHTDIEVLVPKFENDQWRENFYLLGRKSGESDIYFAYRGFINLLKSNRDFFPTYFEYWNASLKAYHPKSNRSIYWLTNSCGTPSPIPVDWQKRRVGSGFESISDSKTSVGMDRTDDIKKGIYQVLKLGAEGKPSSYEWDCKVGIISNIHPARHFKDYLETLVDIVWTNDRTGNAKHVGDLPDEQKLYNLFDGIIALTETLARDEWINKVFNER